MADFSKIFAFCKDSLSNVARVIEPYPGETTVFEILNVSVEPVTRSQITE